MDYNNNNSRSIVGNIFLLSRGAEAIVYKEIWNGIETVVKKRLPKLYRESSFDKKIREKRTRIEAKIMDKLSNYIKVPKIYEVKEDAKRMAFINGKHIDISEESASLLGSLSFHIHKANIAHNDLTIANVIVDREAYVIDFGLSFYTNKIEDKATCLYCTYASFASYKDFVINAYQEEAKNENERKYVNEIIKRLEDIRKRMRYT